MGWAHCGLDSKGREIGYAIATTCDEPECAAEIDRGLAYACGGMHGQAGYAVMWAAKAIFALNIGSFASKPMIGFVQHACGTWRQLLTRTPPTEARRA